MAIDSAISSTRLLMVRPGHDDKAQQQGYPQEGRKKRTQEEPSGAHPIVNEQGQTMGKVIDTTA
ncbi:MAG: hypothetical protein PHQ05_06025 [Sterolibacterium sp.]|nr:hypothetical protein [Sterolibacterium sp.]